MYIYNKHDMYYISITLVTYSNIILMTYVNYTFIYYLNENKYIL